MKKIIFIISFLVPITMFSQNWKSNFEEAKAEAIKQEKNILLVFSGSDWCAPCIKLDKNIWQSEEFKKYSDQNYILYKADFPKKKANQLSDTLKNQNNALAEKYNQNGNYPLVVLLDKNGKVLGMTGYKNVSPNDYLEILKSLDKK
jgi:thioredoxin-related protein